MAKISIHELKQFVRIGVTDEERAFPQELLLDIVLEVDSDAAERSDDIADTLDYMSVILLVERACKDDSWRLLERFSADMCDLFMKSSELIQGVSISTRKRIHPSLKFVSVELSRNRQEQ